MEQEPVAFCMWLFACGDPGAVVAAAPVLWYMHPRVTNPAVGAYAGTVMERQGGKVFSCLILRCMCAVCCTCFIIFIRLIHTRCVVACAFVHLRVAR